MQELEQEIWSPDCCVLFLTLPLTQCDTLDMLIHLTVGFTDTLMQYWGDAIHDRDAGIREHSAVPKMFRSD